MIRSWIERLNRWITYLSLACLTVVMFVSSADALGRYFFNHPIEGAFQFSEDYLLVLAVFLALGYSYQSGSHVRVTFAVNKLGSSAKRVAEHAVQWFSLACALALAFATGSQALDLLRGGARSNGLISYPLWPANFCVFLGCLLLALLIAMDVPRVKEGKSPLQADESSSTDEDII